jgi:phosphoribosylanthranilate isomerase
VTGTLVKVCGITRLEDARVAVDAGADWLGVVLSGTGPRRIAPEQAAVILQAFPGVPGVAVMVSPDPAEALRLARVAGAARVQLHGVDAAAWPDDFPLPVTFAITVGAVGVAAGTLPDPRHLILVDSAASDGSGGTGRTFDWDQAVPLARTRPIMIAGGLDGGNVARAIERVRPFGVDAASRLERAPGIKDAELVRRFVAAVRACDERLGNVA